MADRRRRRLWLAAVAAYAAVLAASHLWMHFAGTERTPPRPEVDSRLELPVFDAKGMVSGRTLRLSVIDVGPRSEDRPAVLLMHGSPGTGGGFAQLARLLSVTGDDGRDGYRVIAPDLPGFGASDRDLPNIGDATHARTMLAMLDALGVERAHVVGWSNGGAVALRMADLEPDRVASLTLLASVGAQEAEGSGSYLFEHAKYDLGLAAHALLRWLTPHFGALHSRDVSWLRNFDDADLRPMRAIMERTRTPTLILHGRHDFLTPAWGAELHHRLMPRSRLVMLDASHFIPFMQAEEASGWLLEHFGRHDQPFAMPRTDVVDLAPVPPAGVIERGVRWMPWWAAALLLMAGARRWPETTAGLLGALVAWLWVDFGIALTSLVIAMLVPAAPRPGPKSAAVWLRRAAARPFRTAIRARTHPSDRAEAVGSLRRSEPSAASVLGATLGSLVWSTVSLIVAYIVAQLVGTGMGSVVGRGPMDALVTLAASVVAVHLIWRVASQSERQRLKAAVQRLWTHEFWPSWAYYTLLSPWLACLAVRHRGVMTWTCANPGMPMGGGIIGESKGLILRTLERAGGESLAARLIDAGPSPAVRAHEAVRLVESDPALGGWPVILKPDSGFRGFAVRRAEGAGDVERYCREMPRAFIVQRHHPGPEEFGVLWCREPETIGDRATPPKGSIFGITTKRMPSVRGDGRRTLEALILADRRLRLQSGVFLDRLGVERDRVPEATSVVPLGFAGNHSQGCAFGDGGEHATPELLATLTRLAEAFEGSGMDFGRFDLRCASVEQLRTGTELGVVELNGTTSEATNLYEPGRPLAWRLGILARQWSVLFEIGARRRSAGSQPIGIAAILRGLASHYRDRPSESAIG